VINVDHAYVFKKEEFEFIDGIFELCREAKRLNYLVFVITNQAGIARGYYAEHDFNQLTDWMNGVFVSQGCEISKVYYCPYHPEHGIGEYKRDTDCRKPKPGMILCAVNEFGVDVEYSVLLGDKSSDIEAGRAAGAGAIYYFPTIRRRIWPRTKSVNRCAGFIGRGNIIFIAIPIKL
jgi:D-glycero-D-manno-heptose 1,7-bisphosphate phosphatase